MIIERPARRTNRQENQEKENSSRNAKETRSEIAQPELNRVYHGPQDRFHWSIREEHRSLKGRKNRRQRIYAPERGES